MSVQESGSTPVRQQVTSHLLFFTGQSSPPPLHSFPTRRSSDLARHAGHPQQLAAMLTTLQKVFTLDFVSIAADRKSTRLNSSHQIISYAVFCLKKKIKQHERISHNKQPPKRLL